MAKKVGDICVPTGSYIDRETNEEKKIWTKCGVLLETEKGFRIKMDVVPLGGDGWFSVFEPRDSSTKPKQQGFRDKPKQEPEQPDLGSDDDDFPF